MFKEWPILPNEHKVDCTSTLVSIPMGRNVDSEHICQSVPKCVDVNAAFVVDMSSLGSRDDVSVTTMGHG